MIDPTVARVLKRLKNDFRYYAPRILKIRTKDAEIKPLVLNPAQAIFLDHVERQRRELGYVRIIVLKGRQQGISTVINGCLYQQTSMNEATKSLVVAHKAESTSALFDMTKRFYDSTPAAIRPARKYKSKRELSFSELDSSYLVVTAGGDDIARGETLQNAHLSEVAFWPKTSAQANFNGLMKAVPPRPGSHVFVESTANGMSGVFADLWRGAVAGTNGFRPVFIPWFVTDEYRVPVPEGFKRTPQEDELVARYGLDDEQLMFRRREIAQSGEDLFKQEYPCCAEEAFLTTGSPVFHTEAVEWMRETHMSRDFTAYGWVPGVGFRENSRGELAVWSEPKDKASYFIGADVAMGIKGRDYSVAVVLDDERRVVARYRAHINPEAYADVLEALGKRYNTARIVVESNNHGLLTCTRLGRDLAYPNFFLEETVDEITQEYKTKLGFATTAKTKPLIIDELRTEVYAREIIIPDPVILSEMRTYIVDENGRMTAENGKDINGEPFHDDAVMALALANHIYEEKWSPITVTDDFYIENY
ncbi:hypothetical protein [Acetobacter sp. UBA5411]|uniref:hypothetical protein n=1 Tax=Acetobacter sp. UBA5411 TaxID=1945905 RepID=UPI0025BEE1A6|nr:hypothetical protein [Acetobacter sp. UBA5411]